jgi:hypothetical protein
MYSCCFLRFVFIRIYIVQLMPILECTHAQLKVFSLGCTFVQLLLSWLCTYCTCCTANIFSQIQVCATILHCLPDVCTYAQLMHSLGNYI